jgi:hypothetical protein
MRNTVRESTVFHAQKCPDGYEPAVLSRPNIRP